MLPGLPELTRFEQLKVSGDLPSPKGAALAIIRLTQKETTSIPELAHAVKIDPAFAGRIIKTANGVRPVGRRAIASIPDALTIIGVPAVRTLALGFSLLSGYRSGNCKNFDYARYWSHSLVSAVALQAISVCTHAAPADEAFSIGLLSRVGELAMATLFPDDYSHLIEESKLQPRDVLVLHRTTEERAQFAITHGQLSAAMMLDWGMPKLYAEAAIRFENADDCGATEGSRPYVLTQSLALADLIADICLADDTRRRGMMPRLLLLGSRISIATESLLLLCDKVATEWGEWAQMLNVKAVAVPSFEQMTQARDVLVALTPVQPDVAAATVAGGSAQDQKASRDAKSMRILVADSDAAMRAEICGPLKQWGHEVFEATNGQQAFDMALDLRPQIMVVDWLLAELSGVELTRTLRQTRIGRSIYMLILTAMDNDTRLIEAFEAGVDDFLSKPLNPRVFGARLRAGQRVIRLQQELEHDREEIRRFAAELAVTNRRLQEASVTDPLTGFPNRRYAVERFEQEWAAADRSKRPLCCMVVDVDAFKQVNDVYGHDVGDRVLKIIVNALKSGLRGQDVLARIGGDEFLVICPDTPLEAALACAERVRRAVDVQSVVTEGLSFKGSISVGVAIRDQSMTNYEALIKVADKGVYAAKHKGRNCVVALQG